MDYKTAWQSVDLFLQEKNNVLLLIHEFIDVDALASMISLSLVLKERGHDCTFLTFESIFHEIPLDSSVFSLSSIQKSKVDISDFDGLIVLDTGEPKRLGKCQELFIKAKASQIPILSIDHHPDNKMYGDINLIDSTSSANCEILYRLFISAGVVITQDLAHILLWGILADTRNLATSTVTAATLRVASELIDLGAGRIELVENLPLIPNVASARFWGGVLQNFEVLEKHDNVVYAFIDETRNKSTQISTSGLDALMREIGGVDVAILFTKRRGNIKVSFRSKSKVNVGAIALSLDGGGHPGAASCILWDKSIEEAVDLVLEVVLKSIEGN